MTTAPQQVDRVPAQRPRPARPDPATGLRRPHGRGRPLGGPAAVVAVHLLTAVVMLRATPDALGTTLPQNLGDPSLNTWILAWQSHALVDDPMSWFDGNMFHPSGDALGYSELMLPLVPVFGVVFLSTGKPLLAHNLVLVGLVLLALLATHALGRHLGLGQVASYFAGFAFTFNAYTFAHLGHLQLLTFGFFPLGLLALGRLHRHRRARDGIALGVASAALVTACLYYGTIWLVWLGVAGLVDAVIALRSKDLRRLVPLGIAAGTTLVLLAPIGLLLLRFQDRVDFHQVLDPTGGLDIGDLLAPAPGSYLYRSTADALLARPMAVEHTFFPGLVVVAAAAAGVVVAGRTALPRLRAAWRSGPAALGPGGELWLVLACGAAVSFAISLGPSVLGLPAPFRLLYELVPGFDSIRVPARLVVPALLVLALVAGRGIHALSGYRAGTALPFGVVAVGFAVVELAAPVPRVDARPPALEAAFRSAVADLPPGEVVELPVAGSSAGVAGVYAESARLLHSIGDWRPRFNGTSRGSPPGYLERADVLNRFPEPESIELAEDLGLDYVLLRIGDADSGFALARDEAEERLARLPDGASAREIPGGIVVRLAGAAT